MNEPTIADRLLRLFRLGWCLYPQSPQVDGFRALRRVRGREALVVGRSIEEMIEKAEVSEEREFGGPTGTTAQRDSVPG